MDALQALDRAYGDLRAIVTSLDEPASWLPTRCAGWAVRDLVAHHLGDAQRALVALGTPADGPADRDAATYWLDSPGAPDAESRGIRALRTMASAWKLDHLTATYAETTAAAVTLARRTPSEYLVATQGHVLRLDDLVATLVVEATVHHLDLVVDLHRPAPAAEPLALTRRTLDTLLGRPTPPGWDDAEWVLTATGRRGADVEQRAELGADLARLPLLR
jgi:hypothetical protein